MTPRQLEPALRGEAIDLEELVERAALQTRVDRKYLVPLDTLDGVISRLEGRLRVLDIDGRRGFGYRSVYFDTPELDAFFGAAHARRRRFKIRSRHYVDSDECYLEVKTRGARSATVKERIEYSPDDAEVITGEGRAYVDETLDAAGIHGVDSGRLVPTLVTEYTRATFYVPESESRMTVDVDLRWERGDAVMARPGLVIVETKSGPRASAPDRVLWASGCRPARISKYATGLAALDPDLPSNKWNRVIRRHFPAGRHDARTTPTPLRRSA